MGHSWKPGLNKSHWCTNCGARTYLSCPEEDWVVVNKMSYSFDAMPVEAIPEYEASWVMVGMEVPKIPYFTCEEVVIMKVMGS